MIVVHQWVLYLHGVISLQVQVTPTLPFLLVEILVYQWPHWQLNMFKHQSLVLLLVCMSSVYLIYHWFELLYAFVNSIDMATITDFDLSVDPSLFVLPSDCKVAFEQHTFTPLSVIHIVFSLFLFFLFSVIEYGWCHG
jgi:hypothetical protein